MDNNEKREETPTEDLIAYLKTFKRGGQMQMVMNRLEALQKENDNLINVFDKYISSEVRHKQTIKTLCATLEFVEANLNRLKTFSVWHDDWRLRSEVIEAIDIINKVKGPQ